MVQLKHLERFYPLTKGKFFYVLRDINLDSNEGLSQDKSRSLLPSAH